MADVFKTQLREQQRRKEMELETRAREKLELARVISTLSTDRYSAVSFSKDVFSQGAVN